MPFCKFSGHLRLQIWPTRWRWWGSRQTRWSGVDISHGDAAWAHLKQVQDANNGSLSRDKN